MSLPPLPTTILAIIINWVQRMGLRHREKVLHGTGTDGEWSKKDARRVPGAPILPPRQATHTIHLPSACSSNECPASSNASSRSEGYKRLGQRSKAVGGALTRYHESCYLDTIFIIGRIPLQMSKHTSPTISERSHNLYPASHPFIFEPLWHPPTHPTCPAAQAQPKSAKTAVMASVQRTGEQCSGRRLCPMTTST